MRFASFCLRLMVAVVMVVPFADGLAQSAPAATFTNPLLDSGPDPWVVFWKGFYYYMNSTGSNLTIRKTADITQLRDAVKTVVWTPEPGT